MQPVLYPQDIESRRPQIFAVLEHEQIDLIRSLAGPPRRFAPGELVVAAGGLPRMFVVLEGSVDVVRNDGLGNQLLLASYEAGQFSGEVPLLSNLPGISDIKAGPRGCYAIPFTPESVRAIIIAHVEIGEILMRAFVLRRLAMLSADHAGTIVLGRASDRDVRRLQNLFTSNGYPYTALPNSELAPGRYKLVEKLGVGGMGIVYLAEDPQLGRRVAIKLIEPKTSGTLSASEGRARLLREAQALAQLSHPNVIAVYDVGTCADQVFIAMEYVEGSTLSQWLAERRRTWREVLSTFVQAGRGLAAAHAVGIVHRDFKPDNVLVGSDGRVRVLDFGLARPAQPSHNEELVTTDAQALADTKITPRPAMLGITVTQRGKFIGT